MSFQSRCHPVLLALALCEVSCTSIPDRILIPPVDEEAIQISLANEPSSRHADTVGDDERGPGGSAIRLASAESTGESSGNRRGPIDRQPAERHFLPELGQDGPGSPGTVDDDDSSELAARVSGIPPGGVSADPAGRPDSELLALQGAPLEAGDQPFPINLTTALRLADARPMVVAAAQASAWVAEAQLQRAQLLWVPHFNIGAVYYRHDGFGPDFNLGVNNPRYGGPTPGGPLNQNINFFYGYGSVYQAVNAADAIFQPLAARQTLDAQRQDIQTAKNDALLATANAYFEVHQHRGQYAAALHVVDRAGRLVSRIEDLARDLVPAIEAARARRLQASLLQQAAAARERWRIASANLTQILRLDPSAVVVPLESDHLQITLIDLERPLDELIAIGEAHRPEIHASAARVRAAEVGVRREWYRPLLPLILITGFQTPGGMISQFGIFGTGADSSMNHWSLRNDVSLQVVWQLEGFGFGNLARIKDQRGQESDSIVTLFRQQDTVAAEVTAAQARAQAAAVRAVQAERELREAVISYDGNYEGLAETTRFDDVLHVAIRPQEAVQALNQLMISYNRYFVTVAEYNRAQFELYHAVGYPARAVSDDQATGDPVPVDLERPYGLPPVFDGPPPTNR